jgi:hypothetical protein
VRPYVKFDLRNAFNKQPLIGFDTTLTPNNSGPVDALGIPTTYTRGANFGKNTVLTHNPVPREYRFALGFRFEHRRRFTAAAFGPPPFFSCRS